MCVGAFVVRPSWLVDDTVVRSVVVPGVAVGIVSALAFATVHAWLIVPIWSRLAGGIPLAAAAGRALAWAFDATVRARGWDTPIHGLLFGVYMSGTLLPATVVDAVLRLNGRRLGDTPAAMAAGAALFAASGFLAGWISTRRRSTALISALAALALMVVAGGPLPVVRSARGAWLSAGVACIIAAAGAAIAAVRAIVSHRS